MLLRRVVIFVFVTASLFACMILGYWLREVDHELIRKIAVFLGLRSLQGVSIKLASLPTVDKIIKHHDSLVYRRKPMMQYYSIGALAQDTTLFDTQLKPIGSINRGAIVDLVGLPEGGMQGVAIASQGSVILGYFKQDIKLDKQLLFYKMSDEYLDYLNVEKVRILTIDKTSSSPIMVRLALELDRRNLNVASIVDYQSLTRSIGLEDGIVILNSKIFTSSNKERILDLIRQELTMVKQNKIISLVDGKSSELLCWDGDIRNISCNLLTLWASNSELQPGIILNKKHYHSSSYHRLAQLQAQYDKLMAKFNSGGEVMATESAEFVAALENLNMSATEEEKSLLAGGI